MGTRAAGFLLTLLFATIAGCGAGQAPDPYPTAKAPPDSVHAAFPPDVSPCLSEVPCRILPLGDSITYGSGVEHGGGYRLPLYELALARGWQVTFVGTQLNGPRTAGSQPFPRNHEGYVGETIQQVEQRLEAFAASAQADIVLLHIGTNDMIREPSVAPRRAANLIDRINTRYPAALVAVAQIIPLMLTADGEERVRRYNDALAALVRERAAAGRNVILVDHNTHYPPDALPDKVHPDQSGYEFMARTWFAALEQYLD